MVHCHRVKISTRSFEHVGPESSLPVTSFIRPPLSEQDWRVCEGGVSVPCASAPPANVWDSNAESGTLENKKQTTAGRGGCPHHLY